MVGDRLDTDVAFAAAAGMHSLLVFTGVTKEQQYRDQHRIVAASALPLARIPAPPAAAAVSVAPEAAHTTPQPTFVLYSAAEMCGPAAKL